MNKSQINLQDGFLNYLRKESVPVIIYLVNGFQLKGLVKGFDNFTVILDDTDTNRQGMVYKHAISTIVSTQPITHILPEDKA